MTCKSLNKDGIEWAGKGATKEAFQVFVRELKTELCRRRATGEENRRQTGSTDRQQRKFTIFAVYN